MDFSKIQSEILNSQESLIVNAGAGSGKTRVLVEKYLKAFENWPDLKIDQVVAITFTEKAAQEMKDRIIQNVNECLKTDKRHFELYSRMKRELPFSRISTIHSFCSRLIRESTLYAKVDPDFRVVNGISAVKRISWLVESYISENLEEMKEFFKFKPTLSFSTLIEWFKAGISLRVSDKIPPDVDDEMRNIFKKHLDNIITSYKRLSVEESALDFEDLLVTVRDLLKENEDLRQRYGTYFKYIFVDEFQDTNEIQSEIIELLRAKDNRVWYIGDPKQSIYAFRGADVKVFLDITESTKEKYLKLKEMNENYRSSPNLVEFYNFFFSKLFGEGRISYVPQIKKEEEDHEKRVILLQNAKGQNAKEARKIEAKSIVAMITRFISKGYNFSNIAILVRSGRAIWQIENEFFYQGIPSYVIGGKEFFAKEEVRAIYNLIGVMLDPYDTSMMSGFLLSPFVGLSIDELLELKRIDVNLYNGLDKKYPKIKSLIQRLMALKNTVDASQIIKMAMEETHYLGKIALKRDGDKRMANVMKFLEIMDSLDIPSWDVNGVQRIMERGFDGSEEEASALSEDDNVVKIMNVHRSKGLEFPIVIVAQLAKLTVNKKQTEEEAEEEKRILYVAMTRAKEYLVLSKENSKSGREGKWIKLFKDANLIEDKRWTIPNGMENIVEVVENPGFVSFTKKEETSTLNLNEEYLVAPKIEIRRNSFSTTELFEEIGSAPDPKTTAYGNIAHALLEKVGEVKLKEALNEKAFLSYTSRMVESVKKILWRHVEAPLIKEIENSEEVKSEFAIEGNIPKLNIQVIGKIDKLIKTPDGYKIIDFKYLSYNKEKVKDYEFQIALYTFFYWKLTGKKASGVIFFLKDGKISKVDNTDQNKVFDEEIERRVNFLKSI